MIKDLVKNQTCIVVDALATDEPTLSISLGEYTKVKLLYYNTKGDQCFKKD